MDVKTACLHGIFNEEIFMKEQGGYKIAKSPGDVCRLLKVLCPLKQDRRQWFEKTNKYLGSIGCESCGYDPCFYAKRTSLGMMMITLYVDDLLLAESTVAKVESLKWQLAEQFEWKIVVRKGFGSV